jgi:hypothetical protein
MTTPASVPRLDYATPAAPAKSNWLLRLLAALALALLAADAVALAAGFDPVVEVGREPWPVLGRIAAALVVFLLVLAAAGPAGRLAGAWAAWIARGGGGMSRAATVTFIICGTLCVVAALVTEVYLIQHGRTGVTAVASDYGRNAGRVVTAARPPVFGRLLAGSAFLAGVAMVGVGVWGGSGEQPRRG